MKETGMHGTRVIAVVLLGMGSAVFPAAQAEVNIQGVLKTCNECHSAAAVASNPEWPNLMGQKQGYLAAQLRAYRDGSRPNPLMMPLAAELPDAHIEALAAHYAAQAAPARPAQPAHEPGRHVSAYCIACHGIAGYTVNEEWPNIAGLGAEYIKLQLQAYRDGSRHGPPMNSVAEELSQQQIDDVAEYYSRKP
jgi:cytochrome c553